MPDAVGGHVYVIARVQRAKIKYFFDTFEYFG